MAKTATPAAPPGDPFDAVFAELKSGARKSPLARKSPAKTTPAATAPNSALVDKIATFLSGLSDSKRAAYTSAWDAAVQQVDAGSSDENEPTAAPEEAETPSVAA